MSKTPKRTGQQLPLNVPEDLEPAYANMVRIMHSPSELVFDFALKMPGNLPAQVQAQVMMSPLSAKLFLRALGENLSKYESNFGEIKVPGEETLSDYSKLFRPPDKPEDETD